MIGCPLWPKLRQVSPPSTRTPMRIYFQPAMLVRNYQTFVLQRKMALEKLVNLKKKKKH